MYTLYLRIKERGLQIELLQGRISDKPQTCDGTSDGSDVWPGGFAINYAGIFSRNIFGSSLLRHEITANREKVFGGGGLSLVPYIDTRTQRFVG